MPKNTRFRRLLDRQGGKRAKTIFQSRRQHLYHIRWSLRRYLSWKRSLIVTWKILKLSVNTLTADQGYSLLNRAFLLQRIQMRLSKKQKDFSQLVCAFFECTLNFEHFEKYIPS